MSETRRGSASRSSGSRRATTRMPLEALRYASRRSGLHYLLIHYDIPDVDAATWRLEVGGRVGRRSRSRSTSCGRGRRSSWP